MHIRGRKASDTSRAQRISMETSKELTVQQKNIVSRYKNPIVQGLGLLLNAGMQFIPIIGSPAATLIFGGIAAYREQRAQYFLDSLDQRLSDLSDEAIRSDEFTHAFTETAKAALNSKHEEKIRLLANLFANYANG